MNRVLNISRFCSRVPRHFFRKRKRRSEARSNPVLWGLLLIFLPIASAVAQPKTLTLNEAISIAADSSLEAFRSKNMYLAGLWEYRSYKAARLPGLALNLTPAQYYRYITRRYDSGADIDVYRNQQSYYANGSLELSQNIDFLGGTFFMNTDLGYIRNYGANAYSQYTSVPIRVGYQQSLLGYNAFRWEKKIEPMKFEKVKKEFLYNMESVSEQATEYFFALAMAQTEYDMALENVASTDTLYKTGEQRQKIASITKADLLTLRLDAVNARNTLQNADIALKRAMFALASYLNFDKNTEIRLRLPSHPSAMEISVEQALFLARENNPTLIDMQRQVLEAQQTVDKTKIESLFNASLTASIGFNQVANTFGNVYRDPTQQDVFSLTLTIPLIDWGVRKGKYNVARNSLSVLEISRSQNELSIEEDIIMTVGDFNIQQQLIASAEEALELAQMAYTETKQRFMIGKADINSLTLSLNRLQEAQRNYISSLKNYWLSYYKIRKLTLYDFALHAPLSQIFDYQHGM
ncbi:MAG: TolC family protein [Tannerella sp.]|jgi:outer membrane protein TolC|nr:TolC family protein [Tannerella sp.]